MTQSIQDNSMTRFTRSTQDSESVNRYPGYRFVELADQHWDRNKATQTALHEGVSLSDEHWIVIVYLRRHYLLHGQPSGAGELARSLEQEFASSGGNSYLQRMFPGGAVMQGCRFANLRLPSNTTTHPSSKPMDKGRSADKRPKGQPSVHALQPA
jgi:tRNA 2-thiouridine synthesizing protein E